MNTKKILGIAAVTLLVAAALVGAGAADYVDADTAEINLAAATNDVTVTSAAELQDALSNATVQNNTVTLTNDVYLDHTIILELDPTTPVTLNLAGFDISSTGDAPLRLFWLKSGELTITGKGYITSYTTNTSSVIRVGNNYNGTDYESAKLTVGKDVIVSNINLNETDGYGITVFGIDQSASPAWVEPTTCKLTLVVNGTIYTNTAAAIGTNGSKGLPVEITTGSTARLYSTNDAVCYFPAKGTYNISGQLSGLSGLEFKAGNAEVNLGEDGGTVITATATEATHKSNTNGPSTSGFALVIVKNAEYYGKTDIDLNGNVSIDGLVGIITDHDVAGSDDKDASIEWTGANLNCSNDVTFTDLDTNADYIKDINCVTAAGEAGFENKCTSGILSGSVVLPNSVEIPTTYTESKPCVVGYGVALSTAENKYLDITGTLKVYGELYAAINSLSTDTLKIMSSGVVYATFPNLSAIGQGIVLENDSTTGLLKEPVLVILHDDNTTVEQVVDKIKSASAGAKVVKVNEAGEDPTTASGVEFTANYTSGSVSPENVTKSVTVHYENENTGQTIVGVNTDVTYKVTIPGEIYLTTKDAPVSADYAINVTVPAASTSGANVVMKLTGAQHGSNPFYVQHALDGTQLLPYTIKIGSNNIKLNDTIVSASQSVSGETKTTLVYTLTQAPSVAGSYTDVLTFTVSIV